MFSTVVTLALVASAAAQGGLSLVRPSPQDWWVADSVNTLQWTPCDTTTQASIPAFNVVVMNSNQTLLPGNFTILGNEPTYDCSKTITPSELQAGTGYTMFLTNAINTNEVYTSSQFEIKAKGSPYPPQDTSTAASPTNTSSVSSPSTTAGSKSGASGTLHFGPLKALFGVVVAGGLIGALL